MKLITNHEASTAGVIQALALLKNAGYCGYSDTEHCATIDFAAIVSGDYHVYVDDKIYAGSPHGELPDQVAEYTKRHPSRVTHIALPLLPFDLAKHLERLKTNEDDEGMADYPENIRAEVHDALDYLVEKAEDYVNEAKAPRDNRP